MKVSIYTSLYNLQRSPFDWKASIRRFSVFADEVVVGTSRHTDDVTLVDLQNFVAGSVNDNFNVKLVVVDVPFTDYDFDGRIKNAALQECTGDVCTLLDADEYIPLRFRSVWRQFASELEYLSDVQGIKAFMFPVIDLYEDTAHACGVGSKWYMHVNSRELRRGVVGFARVAGGYIDITRSDTCELIDKDGNLVKSAHVLSRPNGSGNAQYARLIKEANVPFVVHTGWLNRASRDMQNAFWHPVWEKRAGKSVAITQWAERGNEKFQHDLDVEFE